MSGLCVLSAPSALRLILNEGIQAMRQGQRQCDRVLANHRRVDAAQIGHEKVTVAHFRPGDALLYAGGQCEHPPQLLRFADDAWVAHARRRGDPSYDVRIAGLFRGRGQIGCVYDLYTRKSRRQRLALRPRWDGAGDGDQLFWRAPVFALADRGGSFLHAELLQHRGHFFRVLGCGRGRGGDCSDEKRNQAHVISPYRAVRCGGFRRTAAVL